MNESVEQRLEYLRAGVVQCKQMGWTQGKVDLDLIDYLLNQTAEVTRLTPLVGMTPYGIVQAVDENEHLRAEVARLTMRERELVEAIRRFPLGNHSAHFDPTGGSGTGCPECIRFREARAELNSIALGPPAGKL